jgi:uncharacterized delta-60 repeat protein
VERAQGRRTRRSAAVLVAVMVVGAVFSAGAQAAPGDLDLTFSGDGKQTTDFGLGASRAQATVRQPDGKIVAVGATDDGDFALARYNPNGTLDTSFSGDGRQITDLGSSLDQANAVALQTDGKIVVVGGNFNDFALARYNPNGSLDTSFSGDGRQTTDFGAFGDEATGVALQTDGKIVAVGATGGGPSADFALARYNPNGSLDTSFSGDGRQTTDFGGFDQANGVALQTNGKIVTVGHVALDDFAVARYNPNGSLDTSFSGDGRQTTDVGGMGFDDQATGVALQTNGRIVAVGPAFLPGGNINDFALARYNPNGSLDTSFSGDGRQTTDFGGSDDRAAGVALQGDGKIVAVGRVGDFGARDFALARYNVNGSLDPSFSGDGRQTTDFGGPDDLAAGVAVQTNGKIVAVGVRGAFGDSDFALARYNPNGSLDPNFSGDGRQTTDFAGPDAANGVALQTNGKIVAVGGAGGDFALARYNPNGSLDTSFSGDGRQTTDFGGMGFGETARAVALQANGKIVAVGVIGDDFVSASDFALARYNPNGSLDTSFSGDGRQTINFGGDFDQANGVAIQGDGRIVAVGVGGDAGDFALARYNPNGSPDTSFSGDGKQTTDFGGPGDAANGVALTAHGKIVAVGATGPDYDFALARYNPNGSLDPSFSGDGRQTTDFFGGLGDVATGVALQANGKIVAVGSGGLARYNPNGSLDTSFSGDGRQTDFGGNGVALQPDGKIVAAGVGGAGYDQFALARFNPNGSLDTSFSGDGKQRTDFGGSYGQGANAVALQGNGKIVAVGAGIGPSQTTDFALARYLGG